MNRIFFYNGPLSQFDVVSTITCKHDPFFFFFSSDYVQTLFLSLLLTSGFLVTEFYSNSVRGRFFLSFCTEKLAVNTINSKNAGFSIFIEGLFGTVFLFNFLGLLPFSQTMTSQLIFTFFLSFVVMLAIWMQAFFTNKILFISHFLPNGAPLIIAPFIIVIEVISNISRIVSLPVRLFANLTSGHALLKILSSFVFVFFFLTAGFKVLCVFPLLLVAVIVILEALVAFLQTYVFITLIIIYINEQEFCAIFLVSRGGYLSAYTVNRIGIYKFYTCVYSEF